MSIVQDVEKSNRLLGLKTVWWYCKICTKVWAFDHIHSERPIVHVTNPGLELLQRSPNSFCPDCEDEIMKKGFEVDYGNDD